MSRYFPHITGHRLWLGWVPRFCAVALLTGCPEDDPAGGTAETGGPELPEPLDPFDGQGSEPPGNPDPTLTWQAPSSLGNGLVYDSRFDIEEQATAYSSASLSGMELAQGIDWQLFVPPHQEKSVNGFRPTAVDADVSISNQPDGGAILSVVDRCAYIADEDSNYRHQTLTYAFSSAGAEQSLDQSGSAVPGEPRPTSIDTYAIPDWVGESVVWTYDNNPVPWTMVVGQETATFLVTANDLVGKGYRPISVASRRRNATNEYSAIFLQDGMPASDWSLDLGLDWTTLQTTADQAWAQGFYPLRGTYEQGSAESPIFDVLWAKRSPELTLEMRYNLDQALFDAEDISRRSQGYSLENALRYTDAGEDRYAGLWVRHDPYFREDVADQVTDNNPTFISTYKPFEDQVIQSMTLAGEQKEGEYFRPSATLHVWQGNDLVVNRAYTFAPSIYPDTPVNASMAVASVSKSITAAAVVKVLNQNNLPLSSSFAVAAGLANVWPQAPSPTIAAVLGNRGGFENQPVSYFDHVAIAASVWADLPVDEEELTNYVVGEGLLGAGQGNAYWTAQLSLTGEFRYSNPGFSMLAELVRVQSGTSYEEYVGDQILLDVLNMDDNIFANRGHRNTVDSSLVSGLTPLGMFEPNQAHLRKYLINTSHPYVCTDNPPCNAIQPPVDSSASPATWGVATAAPNPSAPDYAARIRYAGSAFLGGAPLAAGGWHSDGKSLGELMRVITRSNIIMPNAVAAQLWAPQWLQFEADTPKIPANDWAYGLGWYVRGNWVAWAGGSHGSSSLVLHNLVYDFTVVSLSNVIGNGFVDVLGPLFTPACTSNNAICWDSSVVGALFPCVDDPNTPANECSVKVLY